MDTSEQYIDMCEKAVEIQKHEWRELDVYWCDAMGGGFGYYRTPMYARTCDPFWHEIYGYHNGYRENRIVWLPRQDQLQEMVSVPIGTFNDNFWTILEDLRDWGHNYAEFQQWIPLSMEQLWLAFVMNEKYNKVWNGEDWVK